jgi:acetyl esterase/lipase
MRLRTSLATLFFALLAASVVRAQTDSSNIRAAYVFTPDVTYLQQGAWEGKLDIYTRADSLGPHPTLVFFHGGADDRGNKEKELFNLLRYVELGWNVVNVEHRLPGVTLGPTAMQNGWCALRWVVRNAPLYGFDAKRLVVSGQSAGGWAALTTAMAPPGWADTTCPGKVDVRAAAIVNWYGVTDPAARLEGENASPGVVASFRGLPNPIEVARTISPVHLVKPSVPPVISIHGEADTTVPYDQATRLHELLKRADATELLITIPRGAHGGFSREENRRAYDAIEQFLGKLGIRPLPFVEQAQKPAMPSPIDIDPNVLSRYLGRYRANSGDILNVTRQGDRTYVQQNSRQRPIEIVATGEREFFTRTSAARLTFVVDDEGHTFGVIVYSNGRYASLPKIE